MAKKLYIIRGVPGCGKTTFANDICDKVVSADDYHYDDEGNYNWKPENMKAAHRYSQGKTRSIMETGKDVAVANTSTTVKEMKPYYKMAEEFGYTVFSIIVENRHGGENTHNVPEATLEAMEKRFDVKLR
jgi:predicted kinase